MSEETAKPKTLHLSEPGAEFIGHFEGFVGHLYNDAANNATIGYGHLLHLGPITPRDLAAWRGGITQPNAAKLLLKDAKGFEAAVHNRIHVRLTQAQFDALVSFVYNCGPAALNGKVGAAVNARPSIDLSLSGNAAWYQRVQDALLLWDHAGGHELAGLKRRRMAEARLFHGSAYRIRGGNPFSSWA